MYPELCQATGNPKTTSKVMWTTIFSSLLHPCAVVNVLADVMFGAGVLTDILGVGVGVGVGMFTDIGIMVGAPRDVNMVDVLAVAIVNVVAVINVGMLADGNANVLAAVMTSLAFTLSAP